MKERILYIDSLKGIGIILVSWAHILGNLRGSGDFSKTIMLLCYAIELPLFFAVSGMLIKKEDTLCFIKKRMGTILYPYITFSALYILIDLVLLCKRFLAKDLFVWNTISWDFIDAVSFWGIGPLWFLPVLFCGECIFNIILKIRGGRALIFGSILVTSILCSYYLEPYYDSFLNHTAPLPIYLMAMVSRTLCAVLFMIEGYYARKLIERIVRTLKLQYLPFGGIIILIIGLYIGALNKDIVDLYRYQSD